MYLESLPVEIQACLASTQLVRATTSVTTASLVPGREKGH
jgi:hypothetical protein